MRRAPARLVLAAAAVWQNRLVGIRRGESSITNAVTVALDVFLRLLFLLLPPTLTRHLLRLLDRVLLLKYPLCPA